MEAQEKSERRKDFLGGGKHLGVSQSEAVSVERKQESSGERRRRKYAGTYSRKRKGSFF